MLADFPEEQRSLHGMLDGCHEKVGKLKTVASTILTAVLWKSKAALLVSQCYRKTESSPFSTYLLVFVKIVVFPNLLQVVQGVDVVEAVALKGQRSVVFRLELVAL